MLDPQYRAPACESEFQTAHDSSYLRAANATVITVHDIYRLFTVSPSIAQLIVYHGSHPLAHVTSRNHVTTQLIKM